MVRDVAPQEPSSRIEARPEGGFNHRPDERRAAQLRMLGAVESALRDLYAIEYEAGRADLGRLSKKLGLSRRQLRARLTGGTQMTLSQVAEIAWALGRRAEFSLFRTDLHESLSDGALGRQDGSQPSNGTNTELLEADAEHEEAGG